MSATAADWGEALQVAYVTCRHHRRRMPSTDRGLQHVLTHIAAALPSSREARAEACLLVVAELRSCPKDSGR